MNSSLPQLDPDSWFVIARLSELQNKVLVKKLFKREYVLFKDEKNQLCVLKNYCIHRGYPLEGGRIINGELECPYHGWCFNTKGECTHIPGLKEKEKYNFKAAPITHKVIDDFIWISLKPEANPFPTPKLLENCKEIILNYTVKANHYLLIENTLDPFHTPFIHAGLVRSKKQKNNDKKVKIELCQEKDRVEAKYLDEGKQSGLISALFGSNEDQGYGRYIHPGILQLEYKDKIRTKLLITSYLTPVDHETTTAYVRLQYPAFPLRLDLLAKPIVMPLLKLVIKQDQKVCERQQQNLLKHRSDHFISTSLDYMYKRLREIIKTNGEAEPLKRNFDIFL